MKQRAERAEEIINSKDLQLKQVLIINFIIITYDILTNIYLDGTRFLKI